MAVGLSTISVSGVGGPSWAIAHLSLGPGDRGEGARAQASCHCEGLPAVGLHPISGFVGEQRRGDAPADLAFVRPRAGEPRPPRAGCSDKDEGLTWGRERTDECSDGTVAGPNRLARDDRRVVVLRNRGDGNRSLMAIHAKAECARLRQG
jgi:hypothetical protein